MRFVLVDLLLRTSSHSGVMLDPVYTVKAVNGMLTEMANNPQRFKGKRVLFVHTGGYMGVVSVPGWGSDPFAWLLCCI